MPADGHLTQHYKFINKTKMKTIDKIYVNGEFVKPHGTETFDLINPTNNELIGRVVLGDEIDTRNAIAAAREAFKTFSKTTVNERIDYLQRLYEASLKRKDALVDIMVKEYGGTLQFARLSITFAINSFTDAIATLHDFDFTRTVHDSKVVFQPLGVVGLITPWNSSTSFITSKLSMAIAAGCTAVIKPSEMSAMQTQVLLEAMDEAGLPPGIFNVVNGSGNVVGHEITINPDIAKISFTGSTVVGKTIAHGAIDTLKRVTLELGGKSPNIILDDADFEKAIPLALIAAFQNSGQACIAGTRLLVPENRLDDVKNIVKSSIAEGFRVGDPQKEDTAIGPMVSKKQYERVQEYIKSGLEQGAELVTGGLGHPEGLEGGNFVKPTVFAGVMPDMRIAREEIFGPVLSILTFRTEEDAIALANDTVYGLQAYVSSGSRENAERVANQIDAGRVLINGLFHDPLAPFGGFKQSGIGREYGVYGLQAYLEPRTLLEAN